MAGFSRFVHIAAGMGRRTASAFAVPTFVRERCLRYRHAASGCTRCVVACPTGALTLSSNRPSLNAAACTACGSCASACPVESVVAWWPADRELVYAIAVAATEGTVAIACAQTATVSPGNVTVTCLARIDPSLLLTAASAGARRIYLLSGNCVRCPSGNPTRKVRAVMADTVRIADALGTCLCLSLNVCAADIDLARRAWFARWLGRRGLLAPETDSTAVDNGDAVANAYSPRLPEKRRRLVDAMRTLTGRREAVFHGHKTDVGTLFPVPRIDATRCTGCTLCATACPTGALTAATEADHLRLTCDTTACIACGLCTEVCYRQAIALHPSDGVAAVLTPCATLLLERSINPELLTTWEDRLGPLLDARIYRT